MRDNLLSFLADGQLRTDDGQGYPLYVEKELRDFVACGDLSRGFARVRCKDCGFERLLPFSCKNRASGAAAPQPPNAKRPGRRSLPWAELLRRIHAVDALLCPRCAGPMVVLAFLTDPDVVGAILQHLGLPRAPVSLTPAPIDDMVEQLELFGAPRQDPQWSDTTGPALRRSRGPPRPNGDWVVEYDEPEADDVA